MNMSICIKRDKKIKLSIIGSVGLPANYGGWETLVDNVIKFIAKDLKITVFCSSKVYKTKIFKYKKAKLIYINLHPNGFQSKRRTRFFEFFLLKKRGPADGLTLGR